MTLNSTLVAQRSEQGTGNQEPRSPSEKYLAALWRELIGLERVSLSDKFLQVGGNSLTLNILLTRIEAEKGAAMDAQSFFDDDRSSLVELAKELDSKLADRAASAQ